MVADAGLLVEGFMVTEGVREASVRVGGAGSIEGSLLKNEASELPVAGIET